MSPADLAHRIAALDWSGVSLQHQLAISATLETLKTFPESMICGCCGDVWQDGMTCGQKENGWPFQTCYPSPAVTAALETLKGLEPMTTLEAVQGVAIRQNGETIDAANVYVLPVKARTCWTTLRHLDGREWATSSHFGPGGAWEWIVESVAHEHSVSEDQIGCAESGEDQPYDCDDLVTIDGLPVYRIRHISK